MKDKLKGAVIAAAAIAALGVGGAAIAGAAGGGDDDATGGGKVTGTEVDDEESYYEVEVTRDDGSQVDVQLDRGFSVVSHGADSDGAEDEGSGEQ